MSDFKTLFGQTNNNQDDKKNDIISEQNNTSVDDSNIPSKNTNSQVINTTTDGTNLKKERGDGKIDVINFKNLTQIFNKGKKNEYKLFENFSLNINDIADDFQSVSIMGASGCGKSRLVRLLCGLDDVQSGSVTVYGKPLSEFGNIPMVFQNHSNSNYPWMKVIDNVMLPMIIRGISKKDAYKKAVQLLKLVGLEDKQNDYPNMLSGGQNQRVAISKCLATNSQIIVLDEATGALDIKMKREIQNIILRILYGSLVDPTIINITHSIEEALYLSNKIIILKANPCGIVKVMNIHYNGEEDKHRGEWIFQTDEYKKYYAELSNTLANI